MREKPLDGAKGTGPVLGDAGTGGTGAREEAGFLPTKPKRAAAESVAVRVIATAGVVGIGTAVGAIMSVSHVSGWIIALVVSIISVILAALLWRSRTL
jgi:protein-S-isoprenylcysteine O-methyltransferase Ste14